MTSVKSLLGKLELGKSVAEFDEDLERYFIETNTFREFINDQVDVVAGDKGTSKTAIYRFIQKRYEDYPQLADVNMLPAFNPSGNPVFQSLARKEPLDEADYVLLWKAYILSLVGNWMIASDTKLKNSLLDNMLTGLDLKTANVTPKSVFAKIMSHLPDFFHWKSAELKFGLSETGSPEITPKVEFGEEVAENLSQSRIPVEDAFAVLNQELDRVGARVWVTFDRLDEAFQGRPGVEIPALRALLRTYLDLLEFENVKLKLFLRKDLFRRITSSGFVNLTHINSRKLEIKWDEEDLLNLLCRRIRQNAEFLSALNADSLSNQELFARIFPDQVDFGLRKPKTWVWIMRRIRDGNDIKPPRNLIDLVRFTQQAQLRREDRESRELSMAPIIESDSLRRGLSQLSEDRVNDTLLAEAGVFSPMIEKFRGGKPSTICRR